MEHVALEDRDQSIPPCDALAEALVLHWLLNLEPERIPTTNLDGLLVFPEHRQIWTVMRQAWAEQAPDEPWARFYLRWLRACERLHTGLSDVLDGASMYSARFNWELRRMRQDFETNGIQGHRHGFEWWLERLRQVAAARQLIDSAQRMAEHAWRGEVEAAISAAASVTSALSAAPAVWERNAL